METRELPITRKRAAPALYTAIKGMAKPSEDKALPGEDQNRYRHGNQDAEKKELACRKAGPFFVFFAQKLTGRDRPAGRQGGENID